MSPVASVESATDLTTPVVSAAEGFTLDEILDGPPAPQTPLCKAMGEMMARYRWLAGSDPLGYPPIRVTEIDGIRYALVGTFCLRRRRETIVENAIVEPDHVPVEQWERHGLVCEQTEHDSHKIYALPHVPGLRLRFYRSRCKGRTRMRLDDPRFNAQIILTDNEQGWGSLSAETHLPSTGEESPHV